MVQFCATAREHHECRLGECPTCRELSTEIGSFEAKLTSKYALVSGLSVEAEDVRATRGQYTKAMQRNHTLPPIEASSLSLPITGLLCGVALPAIRREFGLFARTRPHVLLVGLSVDDFHAFLLRIVPQLEVSRQYAEKMFSGFETSINNATRRLGFVNFFATYGQLGSNSTVEDSITAFYRQFESADLQQLMLNSLRRNNIDQFIWEKKLAGRPKDNWEKLTTAIGCDERISKLIAIHESKVAFFEKKKKREQRTNRPTTYVRKFVNVQADRELYQAFIGSLGEESSDPRSPVTQKSMSMVFGGESNVEPCYCISLQQLRVLFYGSSAILAALHGSLWFPPPVANTILLTQRDEDGQDLERLRKHRN